MEPSRVRTGDERERRQRHRSHSSSYDSEEERRQRRRRKEREIAARDSERGDRTRRDDKHRDRDSRRDRDEDKDRKRRSSRSPDSSRRRTDDRESKHRRTRELSPSHRDSREKDSRGSREGSATQLNRKNKGPLPSQASSFKQNLDPSTALVPAGDGDAPEKQKPNFAPTGLLAAASNSIAQADGTSVVLKYHEPAEARKPSAKDEWKLFVFKGADILETIDLSRRSCWLVGREMMVVDMAAEHPSISKQHAVIQFRYIEKTNEYGDRLGKVKPYLIDLESANGTSLNKEEIPPSRYLELRDKDMIQFGHSTREYVLMLSPKI